MFWFVQFFSSRSFRKETNDMCYNDYRLNLLSMCSNNFLMIYTSKSRCLREKISNGIYGCSFCREQFLHNPYIYKMESNLNTV